jgi:hypothetical protein
VSLDGLKIAGAISGGGGLHALNCSQMTSFSSNSLQASGAWLEVRYSSSLRKMLFPQLDWIGLALILIDVPLLEQLELANGVVVGGLNAPATTFSGFIMNTGLSEIDGIFSGAPYDISIYDNPRLQKVNLPTSQIRLQYNSSYTGSLTIVNNSPNIIVDLPNLASVAGSISIGNVSSLSIPSLALVNGSMYVTNASFPSLSAPQLQTVIGDLNITGAFSRYSLSESKDQRELIRIHSLNFPNLAYIGGNLFLQSTKYFDCGPFEQLYIDGGIKGTPVCLGASTSSSTASSGASATSARTSTSSSSGGGLSAGAKGGIIAAAIVAGLAVIGGVLVIRRKQHQRAIREPAGATDVIMTNEPKPVESRELPQDEDYGRLELDTPPNQVAELRGDRPC